LAHLGLPWVRARLLHKDQMTFLGGDSDEEFKLKELVANHPVSKRGKVSAFASNIEGLSCLLCLSLPEAKAELWLGLEVEDFKQELTSSNSPWVVFLENLATTIGLSLAQIELKQADDMIESHQLDMATNELEIQAQRSVVQSLWLHELGNKAGELASGAWRAVELIDQSRLKETRDKLIQLNKIAKDFSSFTVKSNQPVNVSDKRHQFFLHEAVALVCDYASVVLDSKGIKVHNRVPRDLEVTISFQIAYLVLSNLVTNAIKAIKRGKGGLIIIETEIDTEHDRILCQVKDTGKGVAEEIRDKIFNLGFTTGKEKHSGMGLPGSRKALQKNNGDLWHDSSYKEGACFTMAMPRSEEKVRK